MTGQIDQLSELFRDAGKAHHQAFFATDGDDPEWPLWYAEYLIDNVRPILGEELTVSELVYHLVTLSKRQPVFTESCTWPQYYAYYFSEQYK
ncbi:MAG: hypothetical protein J5I90_06870 [Caldilineales bacterium]|nr:hypothetical protein [Caldilineales bacterium]